MGVTFGPGMVRALEDRLAEVTAERDRLAAALEAAGINFESIRFSQKAGCSMCPCSPGWVADDVLRIDGLRIDDIFVSQVRNAEGEVRS